MSASLITGTLCAMLRLSSNRWIRVPTGIFIDVMRTIPLIMVIFWFFFLMPIVTGRPVTPILAALIALIVWGGGGGGRGGGGGGGEGGLFWATEIEAGPRARAAATRFLSVRAPPTVNKHKREV